MGFLVWLFRLADLSLGAYFALTLKPWLAGLLIGLILAARSVKDLIPPPDQAMIGGRAQVSWRKRVDKFYDFLAIGLAAYLIFWLPGALSYIIGAVLLVRQAIGLGAPGGDATWIFAGPLIGHNGSFWSMLRAGVRYLFSRLAAWGLWTRTHRVRSDARSHHKQETLPEAPTSKRGDAPARRTPPHWRLAREEDVVRISRRRIFRKTR